VPVAIPATAGSSCCCPARPLSDHPDGGALSNNAYPASQAGRQLTGRWAA
jgi:hypothetical protein